MSTAHVIAQAAPAAATLTDIYQVPNGIRCTIKGIVVCNRGGAESFRLSVAPLGEVDALKQYFYYGVTIGGNSTFLADFDLDLPEKTIIRVYSASGNLSFSIAGTQSEG